MIKKFYAVTGYLADIKKISVSLYEILETENKQVTVQKIDLRGSSELRLNDYLSNEYYYLGIMKNRGLQRYNRTRGQRVDDVNTIHWGAKSTPIIALFDNLEEATACFKLGDLQHWDARFIDHSVKVLEEIGTGLNQPITLDSVLTKAIERGVLKTNLEETLR